MVNNQVIFSTREAAAFVEGLTGLKYQGFLHHVNNGHVPFRKIGTVRVFSRPTLIKFIATKRPVGRPRVKGGKSR